MHSRMDVAGAGGGQRVGVFIRVPEAPGHLDAAPGDAKVLEVVVDDLRVDASVLQAEVSAESIEDLAGMRGVEGDSDGVLVDLAGHFEGEAVLAGLAGSGFADEDGEQDLEVVAALAAVVADDDQGRLIEGHLDLAGAGREARALGGGAQVFILLGDAGGERRAFGGGRIGIDELYGAAGKDRGGEFDAEEGAADRGLVGGREFEIDFGGTGAGVFHDFGGGHRPAGALGVAELAGGAHADGDGFGFAVAGVVVLLLLAAGATHRRRLGLGDAHAGTEFQEVALDAQAGQVTPSHDLRLSERYGCESRKEDNGANSPNHHHDSNARMAAIRPQAACYAEPLLSWTLSLSA